MGSLMSMFNFISICPIVATIFFASLWSNLNLKFHQQKKRELNSVLRCLFVECIVIPALCYCTN